MVIGTGRRGRAILVRLHRWAGLLLAGFLTVAGLTGSVIAFNGPLDAWLNPGLFESTPGRLQPLDRLAAIVEASDPALELRGLSLPDGDRMAVRASVGSRGAGALGYNEVFVDGVAGRVLGHRDTGGCCLRRSVLLPFLFRLHYTLAAGAAGQVFMGGLAMLWVLDCVVGLWLTLPRAAPFLARWIAAWRIRPAANPVKLNRNIHGAGGLWCWLALLILAVTAVDMNLSGPVFRPLVAALLPTTPDFTRAATPHAAGGLIGLDRAVDAALRARPDTAERPIYIAHGQALGTYAVALRAAGKAAYAGLGPDWVYVDDRSGAMLRQDRAGHGQAGDTVLQAMYPLHSGQIAGLTGRIAVCALGLAVAGLSVTGVLVWWHKARAARRAMRRPIRQAVSGHVATRRITREA